MAKPKFSDVAKASREQAARIRDRLLTLPAEERQKVDDCVVVLRDFMKQSGSYGILALSLVYWEFSFSAAVHQSIESGADPTKPSNG